jgi:hypothetical protein
VKGSRLIFTFNAHSFFHITKFLFLDIKFVISISVLVFKFVSKEVMQNLNSFSRGRFMGMKGLGEGARGTKLFQVHYGMGQAAEEKRNKLSFWFCFCSVKKTESENRKFLQHVCVSGHSFDIMGPRKRGTT